MIVPEMISGLGLCTYCPFQSHVFLLTNTKILNVRDNLYLTVAVIFRIFTLSENLHAMVGFICLFGVCRPTRNFYISADILES